VIPTIMKRERNVKFTTVPAVAVCLVVSLTLASSASADVWFLGVGNDGFFSDVTGVHNAYTHSPNPDEIPIHSRLLSNRGGSTIVSDINWLRINARPGDRAVFYYSGHGETTYDYNGDERSYWPRNTSDETIGLSYNMATDDQIASALGRIDQAVPVVAIFDVCYAGGMVGGARDLNALPNAFVMMSSREDQVSYGGWGYSRFTQQLVNALGPTLPADTTGDGSVTFQEWFDYTRGRVSGQSPQYFDSGIVGSLPLIPEPCTALLMAGGGWALLRKRRILSAGWSRRTNTAWLGPAPWSTRATETGPGTSTTAGATSVRSCGATAGRWRPVGPTSAGAAPARTAPR